MKRFIVLGKDFDFLLDAFDVFSPNCPLRYICNVSELITGWRLKIWMFLEKHRRLWRITKIWKKFFIYPNLSIDRENEIYLLVSTSWISFMHEGYAEYFKKHFPKSHIIVFFYRQCHKIYLDRYRSYVVERLDDYIQPQRCPWTEMGFFYGCKQQNPQRYYLVW